MPEEATVTLDGVEEQVSAEAVEQAQEEQQQQQGNPNGDDPADAGPDGQLDDGV